MLTIITLAIIFSPLAILAAGIIGGVIKYIVSSRTTALPAPPTDFTALEGVERQERKKAQERDYYTALIANLEDLQRIVEKEYSREKERESLSRLIALDKQIHAARQKLDKLES